MQPTAHPKLGRTAQLAVPTNEHYLPLLYALAFTESQDPITDFNDAAPRGSISIRSLRIGGGQRPSSLQAARSAAR